MSQIAPVIELRGIKRTAWASEETHCYQATLYVDGEKWGTVSNQGHGGCDAFHGEGSRGYADIRELDKRISATMPGTEYEGRILPESLESICCDLVNDWLVSQDFKRLMKSKILFLDPDKPGLWQVPVKKSVGHAATLAAIKARRPNYRFLADMPEKEALDIFKWGFKNG